MTHLYQIEMQYKHRQDAWHSAKVKLIAHSVGLGKEFELSHEDAFISILHRGNNLGTKRAKFFVQ